MSKTDFSKDEFADRLARTRAAISAAGLDWLVVIHPVSMRWLIGQDNKSYTAFQCLPISAEPEDPMEAFAKFAADMGLLKGRVGIEVPSFYLSAPHYAKVKDILGSALVAEPTGMINGLKVVKSAKEIEYHKKSAALAADAW